MTTYKGFIGRTDDRYRVHVEINIREEIREGMQTTDHRTVDKVTRLSIMGHTFRPRSRRRDCDSAGQIRDDVSRVIEPTLGFTRSDIATLVKYWDAWHLNDMQAGCDHQTVVTVPDDVPWDKRTGYRLDNTPRCPVTGYKWGSAWLVKDVPADVLTWMHEFGSKLDGDDGYTYPS